MTRIYLDSCIYIYYFSAGNILGKRASKYFVGAETNKHEILASSLVMHEILSGVYKEIKSKAGEIYGNLSLHPGISWIDFSLEIADLSAQLRSETSLKTPDCIHLATALLSECSQFITNDKQIKKFEDLFSFKIFLI